MSGCEYTVVKKNSRKYNIWYIRKAVQQYFSQCGWFGSINPYNSRTYEHKLILFMIWSILWYDLITSWPKHDANWQKHWNVSRAKSMLCTICDRSASAGTCDQLLPKRHTDLNFPLSFILQTAGMCQCDRCVAGSVYSTDSPLITLVLTI